MNYNVNEKGYYGEFGGAFIPEMLYPNVEELRQNYLKVIAEPDFKKEFDKLLKDYVGRPSPLYFAKRLSKKYNTKIYLKREDLNHTGAHKINNTIGQILMAKRLGKTRIIAETGAGQHGVALATAAAYFGLECEIHMGQVDIEKEYPNVLRMKVLGATVIPATHGLKTLKEAVDSAFESYLKDPDSTIYCIGSVVGPHPFPMIVRDFQRIIGIEARDQFFEMTGELPDSVVACVGGGSNAIGLFSAFLDDDECQLFGVEPAGKSFKTGEHAATMTLGKPGVIHGFKCYTLQDENGEPAPVHSIASGLDYPGIGPEHSMLKDLNKVTYESITDKECIDAFYELSRLEGIIPALESAHAVAYAIKLAQQNPERSVLVNLSGLLSAMW